MPIMSRKFGIAAVTAIAVAAGSLARPAPVGVVVGMAVDGMAVDGTVHAGMLAAGTVEVGVGVALDGD